MNESTPIVLFDGYSKTENGSMYANCSCVLVKGIHNIIIDTMSAWDGEKIKEALSQHNLNCEDINYVICTHGHPDHIGCNYLFQNATHIVGFSISHRDKYLDHDFSSGLEFVVNENVKVIPTPGHTLQDVTVLVSCRKKVFAITGDLFEKEDDLKDSTIWKNAGSDNEQLQSANREMVLGLADYIIPGHGPMFAVPTSYKTK